MNIEPNKGVEQDHELKGVPSNPRECGCLDEGELGIPGAARAAITGLGA